MNATPLQWSVIIPTLNRADSLQRTLHALCRQSLHPLLYEILVVDNGSTDHTGDVVRACMEEFPARQIRFLQTSPPGLLSGRHKGAQESRGNVLTFVDDDIDVAESYGAAILVAFQKPDVHLVGGPCRPHFEAEPPAWMERYCQRQQGRLTCASLSLHDLGDKGCLMDPTLVWGLNFSIRRETLWDCEGFHPDNVPQQYQMFQGDGETGMCLALRERGYKAHYVPGAAVTHVIPPSRLTEAYFHNRFFYQGVCDSYTEIRAKGHTQNLHVPAPLTVEEGNPEAVHQRIRNAYVDGYLFHQNAVKQSPRLMQWVTKQDYWDYAYPELEPQLICLRNLSAQMLENFPITDTRKNSEMCTRTNNMNISLNNIDASPDFYYGEIPQDDFNTILRRAEELNDADTAISEWCDKTNNSYFRSYALDPRRALGLHVLGNLDQKKIMDYGCGIGSLGIQAARKGAQVTFVDNCLPRLRMALMRAKGANASNATGIACQNWRNLQGSIAKFDAILVNGVMEWIPSTSGATFATVVKTQLDFLSFLAEHLEKDGRIYLAIENRFALQYYFGYPEDHTNIPYLSLLNREEANKKHKEITGNDYTIWTWGLNEYKERLPLINMEIETGYALFPDYRFPVRAVCLDDHEGLRNGMDLEEYPQSPERTHLTNYLYQAKLLPHSVYSYALVLKKTTA